MKELITKLFSKFRRVIAYGIVGCINTAVDFVVFTMMFSAVGLDLKLSQGIGYISGVLTSFILNRSLAFKDGSNRAGVQFVRFIVVNAVSFLVSTNLIAWLAAQGINEYVAKVLVTAVVMIINYFGYKILVFGVKEKNVEDEE